MDNEYSAEECVTGRHLQANFSSPRFEHNIKERWPVGKYKFPVIFYDWFFVETAYLAQRANYNYNFFFETNLPLMVREYGTEAVYLPLVSCLVKAMTSPEAVSALHSCGLTRRVLVQDALSNPLYVASVMCEDLVNIDTPRNGVKRFPAPEIYNAVGRQAEFCWVVLQKEKTKYGVDLAQVVPKPQVHS